MTYSKGATKTGTWKPDKDLAVCGARPIPDETLLVSGGGGLANVVVSIEGVPGGTSSGGGGKARVDQQGCRYVPHVQVARLGARLDLMNSDPVLHNVHAYVGDVTQFNMAMPLQNMTIPRKLDKAGVVRLKCDAGHTWMSAYVVVKSHRFAAVTAPDGSFRIDDVPPGTYTLEMWHEKLGTKVVPITVSASTPAQVALGW